MVLELGYRMHGKKLYIGRLPHAVTYAQLSEMISPYQPINSARTDWLLDAPTVALRLEDSRQEEARPPSDSQCLGRPQASAWI